MFLYRNFLRQVAQRPPPSPLKIPIPKSTIELKTNHNDDDVRTLSVTVSDGANQKSQKHATIITMMPSLSSVRELISYVPTLKNIATRGELTGIPYLGDTFDREDQELINSISGESSKQNKAITRSMTMKTNFCSCLVLIFFLLNKKTNSTNRY